MYWEYKCYGKTWGSSGQNNENNAKNLDTILNSKSNDEDNHLIRTYLTRVAGELE